MVGKASFLRSLFFVNILVFHFEQCKGVSCQLCKYLIIILRKFYFNAKIFANLLFHLFKDDVALGRVAKFSWPGS